MQEKEIFPKVLVVDGTPLSSSGNMGNLKSHLLSIWPSTAIAHVVTSGIIDKNSIASRQFIITKKRILLFQSGYERKFELNSPNVNKELSSNIRKRKWFRIVNSIRVFLFVRFYKLYKPLTHILRSSKGVYSNSLYKFIASFNPDIVLSFGVTLPELKAAYKISQFINKPLVIYIADDYISWTYKDHFFSNYLRKEFEKYFSLSLNSSRLRVTIGKKMEEEYSNRYKLSFLTIMDGIDTSLYFNRPVKTKSDELIFYYIGSFEPDRLNNLFQIASTIERINKNHKRNVIFKVLGFENDKLKYGPKFEELDCVEFQATVPYNKVPDLQMSADALVFVESFNEFVSSSMTKFSISTKLSQYIASGTPIFAYGPKDIASIEYLKSLNAAKVVENSNFQVLENELLQFINEIDTYKSNSDVLRKYALNSFSIEEVSRNFHSALIGIVNG